MDDLRPSNWRRTGRGAEFVEYVLRRAKEDKGFAARLRRADNPATEFQSWEILASFRVDLEKPWERMPFALIAAAVAKSRSGTNGPLGLGAALKHAYENGSESAPARARLRRLLACDSSQEVCHVLRPMLALVASKSGVGLDYGRLLDELLVFERYPDRIKSRWAQEFFSPEKIQEEA